MRTFTTTDIKKIFGLKIDRQKDWLTRGYMAPSDQKAAGHGTKNLFSRVDLYRVGLFLVLSKVTSRGRASELTRRMSGPRAWQAPNKAYALKEGVTFIVHPSDVKAAVDYGVREVL